MTVKDCLKYQFKADAQEHPRELSLAAEEGEARIWDGMQKIGEWVVGALDVRRLFGRGRRGVQLNSPPRFRPSDGVDTGSPDDGDVHGEDLGVELNDR